MSRGMGELQSALTFAAVLIFFAGFAYLLGRQERRRSRRKLLRTLEAGFGKPSRKKMTAERYAQVPQYCRRHSASFQVDDITWNDLELDRLFHSMDSTCSASGEEYLYYLLRTPVMRTQDLPFTQDQYAWFAGGAHAEERLRLQEILTSLGHAGRYSLYDYIDLTDALGTRSNIRHYIAAAAPFAAFGLMFLHTGLGILALLAVFAVNLRSYFKEKAEIAPYFQVFSFILRLLDSARALEEVHCPAFAQETARIPSLAAAFTEFRRGSSLLLGSSGGGSDLFGLILDYVRILFHLDLIKFNTMLGQMRGHEEEIDGLLTVTGRIDACISIASWRETLPHFSTPELSGGRSSFEAENLYHPLLTDPVCNNLRVSRPVLLTGSNASGKSTFLKAAAICALLSQTVGIAPASLYRGPCFRIYTSMALRDSLQDGESYFIVEIKSLQRILQAAEDSVPLLCCIDEVLRGTNTVERIAASAEILRTFALAGTLCFAATHDLELTGLLGDVYDNMHFSEEIVEGDVRFSYRLLPGPSDSCNAIALLASLGYDPSIVQHARSRADRFLLTGSWGREPAD